MDALALRTISFTWISHFKLEEIVTPSNLKEDTEISGGIGSRKAGIDFKKFIVIIFDLVEFTFIFRFLASSEMWDRISRG